MTLENDPRQIKYRQMISNMNISGTAVIVFGVWSVLRAILYFVLHRVDLAALLVDGIEEMTNIEHTFMNDFTFLVFQSILVADLAVRVYVGRSAVADAAGRKKSPFYIFLAFVMGWGLASGFVSEVALSFSDDATEKLMHEMTASAVIDLISCFAFFELGVSSVVARMLRKKLKSDGKMIHTAEDK